MRTIHILGILVLLALTVPASPAHAGGVVSVCDEAHLLAALAGGGTVTFECSGTITLTAEIVIAADTTIDGSGQDVTISGNNAVRVFTVSSGVKLNLDELTVANGATSEYDSGAGVYNDGGNVAVGNSTFSGNRAMHNGGGIANYGEARVSNSTFCGNNSYSGGGISNYGMLTVSNSTFSGNSALYGGGISNDVYWATVIVSSSTFSGNSASQAWGGGIRNRGTLIVSNSTFSGNTAIHGFGGAIFTGDYGLHGGVLTVTNSTFSSNGAVEGGGGIYWYAGAATLKNTIIANNRPGGNCVGFITDGGGNLSYPDTTCPGIHADPLLGPLQYSGGPTPTMALGEGSAAIDAGNDAICAADPINNLDQRGITRPQGSHCDIGAVEQVSIKSIWLPAVQAW